MIKKKSSCLKYGNVNNLYGSAMSQKSPVSDFKQIEETFQFNENFVKAVMKIVMHVSNIP